MSAKTLTSGEKMLGVAVSADLFAPTDTVSHRGSLASIRDSDVVAAIPRDHQGGGFQQVTDSLRWVQKHPVLAAVIWVFGKVVNGNGDPPVKSQSEPCLSSSACLQLQVSDGDESSPKKNASSKRLSWNDEWGGTLAEYYEDPRPRFDLKNSDGELLLRCHRAEEETEEPDEDDEARDVIHDREGIHLHHCTTYYNEINGALESSGSKGILPTSTLPPTGTYSPQWGWFINMTPPQEFYPSPDSADQLRAASKFGKNLSPRGALLPPTRPKG